MTTQILSDRLVLNQLPDCLSFDLLVIILKPYHLLWNPKSSRYKGLGSGTPRFSGDTSRMRAPPYKVGYLHNLGSSFLSLYQVRALDSHSEVPALVAPLRAFLDPPPGFAFYFQSRPW